MNYEELILEFVENNYHSIVLATTANHHLPYLRLPDKKINDKKCMSFSTADEKIATEIIKKFDNLAEYIYVDVERKQKIDLYNLVMLNAHKARLRELKPNDLAMEAADILIYKLVKDKNKNILIYGSGNIAFKLAIRLLERNYNVFLMARNKNKVELIIETINFILPKYSPKIKKWNQEKIDVLCSFVSATHVIGADYISFFNYNNPLAIDGGIGNFTEGFISEAHRKNINVLRLDVRLSNEILNGVDKSFDSEFFFKVKGEKKINNIKLVAGGIIGQSGNIIVDQILQPSQIIGVANGYGGVKKIDELTDLDMDNIKIIKNFIQSK